MGMFSGQMAPPILPWAGDGIIAAAGGVLLLPMPFFLGSVRSTCVYRCTIAMKHVIVFGSASSVRCVHDCIYLPCPKHFHMHFSHVHIHILCCNWFDQIYSFCSLLFLSHFCHTASRPRGLLFLSHSCHTASRPLGRPAPKGMSQPSALHAHRARVRRQSGPQQIGNATSEHPPSLPAPSER